MKKEILFVAAVFGLVVGWNAPDDALQDNTASIEVADTTFIIDANGQPQDGVSPDLPAEQ